MGGRRERFAVREVGAVTIAFTALLLATARGYGYHRDELYFRVIGAHPAFGYTDQPPLVPILDHAMDAVSGHSLFWLRVPAALAGAGVVFLTGRMAADLGATRGAQTLAAGCIAVSATLLLTAHIANTTVFDLLTWTLLTWLIARALAGDQRAWLPVGLVAGIGLEVKTLPIFLLFAVLVGVLAAGPRHALRSRYLLAATVIALALWAPNVIWQATHGWPQLTLSSHIANGKAGTLPRWAFLPYQGLLVSPLFVPVWVAGLWQLWRTPLLRAFPVAFVVLIVVFVATGGKPYYVFGIYPILLAAGADPTVRWVRGRRWRAGLVGAAVTLSALIDATLMLPLVPASQLHDTPIVAINYDGGEQVGWPRVAGTVARVYDSLSDRHDAVVITRNYGEAGALDRYRPSVPVYAVQNSYWDLGRPPDRTRTVVTVAFQATDLARYFTSCRRVAVLDNGVDLDNDEQGIPVRVCTGPLKPWPQLWRQMRRVG